MVNKKLIWAKWYSTLVVAFFLVYAIQLPAKELTKGAKQDTDISKTTFNPGTCRLPDGAIAPDISTQARLTGFQGEWAMAIEMLGVNSAGSWFINFTKNGVGEPSTLESFNPPGGWAVVGSHIDKGAAKGNYTFSAKATKYAIPLIVCEVMISIQK